MKFRLCASVSSSCGVIPASELWSGKSVRSRSSHMFRLQPDQDRRVQLGRIVAMVTVHFQRRRPDGLAKSGKLLLQGIPLLRQGLVRADVGVLQVTPQLELERLQSLWRL